MKWTNSQKCIISEIENVNRPIINTETESIFTNSQQTLVQDQMTSQLNSTKQLKKSYYLSSNQSTKLRRKEHFLAHSVWSAAAAAKSLQSCPTLCYPIDSSPPGSPVPGILQARMLEWVAFPIPGHLRNPAIKPKSLNISCIGSQVLYHQRHLVSNKSCSVEDMLEMVIQ